MHTAYFDADVEIYRADGTSDAYGEETPPAKVAEGRGVVWRALPGGHINPGYGRIPVSDTQAVLPLSLGVCREDVVKVLSGPEAGTAWLVKGLSKPRGRFAHVTLDPYQGEVG